MASSGITTHSVVVGPIDTDMNRGFEIPKASTEVAARGIFGGLEPDEEYIFPDPASESIPEGWRGVVARALQEQFKAFLPESDTAVA